MKLFASVRLVCLEEKEEDLFRLSLLFCVWTNGDDDEVASTAATDAVVGSLLSVSIKFLIAKKTYYLRISLK